MALVIASAIRARVLDATGSPVEAVSRMSAKEVETCRQAFRDFTDLVFVYTGGALRVEATEVVLEEPATTLSGPGNGKYWLSARDALRGREHLIPRGGLDSLGVYYKMPPGVRPALHGGAVGRDHGIRGTAYWTLWIHDWHQPAGPFRPTAIASLHEWLHNVSFFAHRVMGETAVPDCHAGEEYGYWDTDGGYPQWMAWNRDLMLRLIPREFWYRLESRGPLLPSDRWESLYNLGRLWRWFFGYGPRPRSRRAPGREGRFFSWPEAAGDWMRHLPRLRDRDLQRLTGLPDLRVTLRQAAPNTPVVWSIEPGAPVSSPVFTGDGLPARPQLDNVLSLGRPPTSPRQGDSVEAAQRAPLEGLAWIRSPQAAPDRRDLVLLRPDLAEWVLPRLRSVGRPAEQSLVGYLGRRDPSEGQRVNLLVSAFDFGPHPPGDELAALGM